MLTQLFTLFATTDCRSDPFFFAFVPWYHYLSVTDPYGACSINTFWILPGPGHGSDIPLVLLAVVDDLLRLAGMIAVGFIIYAAILYITSQGSAEQTSKAQNTIINALIGLAIALVAVGFVSYLGNHLAGT